MTRRTWAPIGALLAVIALVAVGFWLAFRSGEAADDSEEESEEAYEQWAYVDDGPRGRPPARREEVPTAEREEDARRERFDARRAEWLERWRQSVEIVPLGERPPTVTPDRVREALAPSRARLRECVSESGGWRALFRARREQRRAQREDDPPAEGEPRRRGPRSRVGFDVRPDGTVEPESLRFDPPMPEAFAGCFEEHFLSLQLDDVGDGAHVDLPMGGTRRRRRTRSASGDAGVGRDEGRGRGGRRGGGGRRERGGGEGSQR